MEDLFCETIINGKNVFVVENHHQALAAWAKLRRGMGEPPILLSLDHHTDTNIAFQHYSSTRNGNGFERRQYASALVKSIDYTNDRSMVDTILKLRFDEQIDCAIKAGIISKAFVISYSCPQDNPLSFEEKAEIEFNHKTMMKTLIDKDYKPPSRPEVKRPFSYPVSDNGIYVIGNRCAIGCIQRPHNEFCIKPHYDQAIETIFLEDKLAIIKEMVPEIVNLIDKEYILDIDLDYFHTEKSIHPDHPELFYELIRRAAIITIAKEAQCVELVKYKDEAIDSNLLLTELLSHVSDV